MALHEDGGLIVSGRNVAYKAPARAETAVVLDRDPKLGIVGFNDLTTDATGRIYVGSLCLDSLKPELRTLRPGWPHVIDVHGSSR